MVSANIEGGVCGVPVDHSDNISPFCSSLELLDTPYTCEPVCGSSSLPRSSGVDWDNNFNMYYYFHAVVCGNNEMACALHLGEHGFQRPDEHEPFHMIASNTTQRRKTSPGGLVASVSIVEKCTHTKQKPDIRIQAHDTCTR